MVLTRPTAAARAHASVRHPTSADFYEAMVLTTSALPSPDHVNNDPADFENAFWDIASLNVYKAAKKVSVSASVNKRHHGHHAARRISF